MSIYSMAQAMDWHEGEKKMHRLTRVEQQDNPTSPFLTPRAAHLIQRFPLMAVGTLDGENRPWCTVWGGETPMSQTVAQSIIGIRTNVDASFDPVVEAIWQGKDGGEVVKEEAPGRMISALSISLEDRNRVKLAGRMVAGALTAHTSNDEEETESENSSHQKGKVGQIQLVVKIEQSLGNCPKYLNKNTITPAIPSPVLASTATYLTAEAIDLISKADFFFISSVHAHSDMDCNYRGGPAGFLRISQPTLLSSPTTLIWPEYSGNNLYQTLGNLSSTPLAGIVIPDLTTGSVLYITGTTTLHHGPSARALLAKSNLAVSLTVTGARLVRTGLPFRGHALPDGLSPYNPRVRLLTSEQASPFNDAVPVVTAKLLKRTKLTSTIARYRFALSDPAVFGPRQPGQYVALDFGEEMDMGYSHMRDDDPSSLNDDFLRTFTVSSPPAPGEMGVQGKEFEIMVRRVGSVTRWLEWQREGVEVGVRGFGGQFRVGGAQGRRACFVAAGIGITPLLAGGAGKGKKVEVRVLWSVGVRDVGLVCDVLERWPELKGMMTVFLTGVGAKDDDREVDKESVERVMESGIDVRRRRMLREDVVDLQDEVDDWYLCTAPTLRKLVQEWLPGKAIVYENFDY